MSDPQIALMAKKAREIMHNAYAPYSHYQVGACVAAEDDSLFVGCNIENASFRLTSCAEAAAISAMVVAGKKRIKSIVIMGSGTELCAPCGACRQTIREFATPNTKIYLCDSATCEVCKVFTIEQLLPNSFGPQHLE